MSQPAPQPKPPSSPIETLHTPAAHLYTHLHPILVLSLYASQFRAIVADPIPALTSLLPWLAVLQIAYATTCLPPTGGVPPTTEKKKPGEKKKKVVTRKWDGVARKVIPSILSVVATIPLAMPVIFVVLILLGAPLTTHGAQTALCAAHMAILTTMPLVYVHGIVRETCLEIVSLARPMDEVHGAMVGTLVGAWLGVVPIPLDWDREWQKWPVTVVTGAYVGFAVGKLLGGTVLKGKRISLDP